MNKTANANQECIKKKPMPRTDVLSYLGKCNKEEQAQEGLDIKAGNAVCLMFAI